MRLETIAPLFLLAGVVGCTMMQPVTEPAPYTGPAPDRVVEIVAERFQFTPSQVTVEAGTLLEIRLFSDDTGHGFRIVGPGNVNVAIPKRGRGEAVARFEATEPGEYRFECSRVCGAGHTYMRGTIRVTAPEPDAPAPDGDR